MSAQTRNFQRKKKKYMANKIIISTKVNTPRLGFSPPAELHSSCLSLMSFHARGQIYDSPSDTHVHLHTHACAKTRACKHTHRPLFPPHQHSDNTEKPICSAATSRRENMSNSQSECFFLPSLSFQGRRKGSGHLF